MDKIKISSLGILDEQKFKKLGEAREEWLTSGSDYIVNPNTKLSKLTYEMYPKMTNVVVKKILSENDKCKTFVLNEPNGRSLPTYRAGDRVALVVNVDGNRKQELPTITKISLDSIKETKFTINEIDYDGYQATLSWDYDKDLGFDKKAEVIVVKSNDKMYVAKHTPIIG